MLLGFSCEEELARVVSERAEEQGKSVSEYIRDVLLNDLKQDPDEENETA